MSDNDDNVATANDGGGNNIIRKKNKNNYCTPVLLLIMVMVMKVTKAFTKIMMVMMTSKNGMADNVNNVRQCHPLLQMQPSEYKAWIKNFHWLQEPEELVLLSPSSKNHCKNQEKA